MKRSKQKCLLSFPALSLAFLLAMIQSGVQAKEDSSASSTPSSKPFIIYNALLYKSTPDLTSQGLKNISVIYENKLTLPSSSGDTQRTYSNTELIKAADAVKSKPYGIVALDIESWKYDKEGIEKYVKALSTFKKNNPKQIVGYYGIFPAYTYLLYKSFDENSTIDRIHWDLLQEKVKPIADVVNVNMISMYTWGKNMEAWTDTAKAAIDKAKSAYPNKPVYAFIWPQYYDNKKSYALNFIDTKTWRYELETLYKLADGVIIWSNYRDAKRNMITFDYSMPWLIETKKFIKAHNIH